MDLVDVSGLRGPLRAASRAEEGAGRPQENVNKWFKKRDPKNINITKSGPIFGTILGPVMEIKGY